MVRARRASHWARRGLAASFLGLVGAAAVACGSPDGKADELATGLEVPWGVAFLPDGDALVGERDSARVLTVPADGGDAEHVATVPGVVPDGEGGLLGLALSPTYDEDGYVYAYLTAAEDNRIVRFRLVEDSTEVADLEVVLSGIAKAGNHNGGELLFGPDGMLYAGTGDATDTGLAQDLDSLNGKILRMTPTGQPAPDNPFPGSLVWSLGHRNVQGLAFDSDERLWGIEFGQDAFDEVNLIEPGGNYGWPEVEGTGETDGGTFTNPVLTWTTSEASPSGAAVVSTPEGDTLYVAALRGQRLWQVPLTEDGVGTARTMLDDEYGRLRNVAVTEDGLLWITTSNRDGRGDPDDQDDKILELDPAA